MHFMTDASLNRCALSAIIPWKYMKTIIPKPRASDARPNDLVARLKERGNSGTVGWTAPEGTFNKKGFSGWPKPGAVHIRRNFLIPSHFPPLKVTCN